MSISLKADPSGTKGTIQINGVDILEVNSDGSIEGLVGNVGDLFGKKNILGTVSQSGSVPTGKIIERGSNANGEYTKFADGTVICYGVTNSSPISTPSGSVFIGDVAWTYPVVFITPPRLVVDTQGLGSVWCGGTTSGTPSIGYIRMMSPLSVVANISVNPVAIGRWF